MNSFSLLLVFTWLSLEQELMRQMLIIGHGRKALAWTSFDKSFDSIVLFRVYGQDTCRGNNARMFSNTAIL